MSWTLFVSVATVSARLLLVFMSWRTVFIGQEDEYRPSNLTAVLVMIKEIFAKVEEQISSFSLKPMANFLFS